MNCPSIVSTCLDIVQSTCSGPNARSQFRTMAADTVSQFKLGELDLFSFLAPQCSLPIMVTGSILPLETVSKQ